MTVPFRVMSWMPRDVISEPKMNQAASNVQWLYEYTPRALYTDGNLTRSEGLKIASGKVLFTRKKTDTATAEVQFGDFFSTYCQPNIATAVVSDSQRKIFVTVSGFGTLQPDHRGFRVGVEIAAGKKQDKIAKRFWVTWLAMGY